MVELEIAGDDLVVHVKGADKLWALKSELKIPLDHVVDVGPAGEDARLGIEALFKTAGVTIPGLSAGRFHVHGKRVFMEVHDKDRAIEIGLRDERFDKLVVEVADPGAELAKVTRALEAR